MLKKLFSLSVAFFIALMSYSLINLYVHQERLLFKSKPLKKNHKFISKHPFEEIFITSKEGNPIHALLYKTSAPTCKGVILYFHGRGGNLASSWGSISGDFTRRGYDVLVMDYRGFGKTQGPISQAALLSDATLVYEDAKRRYTGLPMIVYGRSLGTGIATYIASSHSADLLILEAPYFNMRDMVALKCPILPKFLLPIFLKYPLRTDQWIKNVSAHIEIFHGTSDKLIPYKNSELLYELASEKNPHAHLTTINGGTHNNLSAHSIYQERLDALLSGPIQKP